MNQHTASRRAAAALTAATAVLTLGACEPAGRAVGDTQEHDPDVAHVGAVTSEILVGLVGMQDADADRMALDAYDAAGLDAVYVSTDGVDDPGDAARRGIVDLVERRTTIIVISGIDTAADAASWDDALGKARAAGIPVALLNPVAPPDDDTLYAANLVVNDRAMDATPLADATRTIIDDEPHERDIMVTTLG